MSNTTILDMPVAITLDGTESVPIIQPSTAAEGVSKRATTAQIAQLVNPAGTLLDPESILGNQRSTASVGTSISGNPSEVLRYSASGDIAFGSVNLSTSVAVTGILAIEHGGIGTSALDSGTVLLGNGTGAVTPLANVTSGYVLTTNGTSSAPSWQVGGGLANQPPLTVLGVGGNATATPSAIGRGATDQVLRVDPSGTGLSFGQVNLSSTAAVTGFLNVSALVTGVVSVPHGGTGTSTLAANALLAGNATGAVQTISAATSGFVLTAQGTASLPSYVAVTGDLTFSGAGTATIATAAVSFAKFQNVTALSVVANASSATGVSAAVSGTANQVLRIDPSGTALAFGQINLSSTSAITGTLNITSYLTGIVTVPFGGTGTGTLTANGVLVGNGTSSVQIAVATATVGYVLQSNGTTSPPFFGAINLSSALVTGIVTVPFGGTGTSTLTAFGLVAGNGTSSVAIVTAGTAGQILTAQTTTSLPIFRSATGDFTFSSVGTGTIATAAVTYAKIQNVAGLSAFANASSAAGVGADVTGTANQVLRINPGGTALGFGQVNLSATGAVTGIVAIANGGTNASVAATAIVNLGGLALNTTGQAFTGGVILTALSLGTATGATTTLVAGNPPLQRLAINGTATIVAPSSDCEIDLLLTNTASAGSVTASGYSTGSTGDTYATTSGSKFLWMSRTVNGSSTYSIKAFQ